MTVSTAYAPLVYAGNDSTTAFAVSWPFFTGSLVVTAIDATGVETLKTITTHYTVSGGTTAAGLASVGTVSMITAPASGTTLRIDRATPKTQGATWGANDAFPQVVIEAGFDRLTMIGEENAARKVLELNTTGAVDYWDAQSMPVRNLPNPIASSDAVTLGYGIANFGGNAVASASGSATAAASSASSASASAATAASATAADAFRWTYFNTTAMADPSTGGLRLNNAALASVTAAAISDLTADTGNPDVSVSVLTWDDSTNTTNRGTLTLRKFGAPQNFAEYFVSGATIDNAGWTQLALTYLTSSGSFTNADTLVVRFIRAGDKGTAGAGTGDMLIANNLSDLANKPTSRTNLGVAIGTDVAAAGANTDITSVNLSNTGLKVKDTDASHSLSIVPGSNLTANRTLTLTMGDASRTLNITGDATIPAGTVLINTNNFSDVSNKTTAFDTIKVKGADIASTSTIDLDAATGDLVDVTGTTAITAIALASGRERTIRAAGAFTLTNGASLILPGGANIVAAAGDFFAFRGYAAGVVRCVGVQLVSGRPLKVDAADVTSGTLVVARGGTGLATATAYAVLAGGTTGTGAFQSIAGVGTTGQLLTSNGAGALPTFQTTTSGGFTLAGTLTTTSGTTQSLVSIPSGYRWLHCEIDGVDNATIDTLRVEISSTNGAAYGTAVNISAYTFSLYGYVTIYLASLSSATNKMVNAAISGNGGAATITDALIATNTAAVINAIRFSWVGGVAFTVGSIRIYGVK